MKKVAALAVLLFCIACLFSCFDDLSEGSNDKPQLVSGEGKYTVEFEVDCIENIFFSKYDIDIYIDGNKLYKLDHGASEVYTVYLTGGEHIIRFTEHYSSSVDGSVRLNVTKNMKLKFTLSCSRNNVGVDMEDKTPFAPDPSFDTASPNQNTGNSYTVNVTFECTENIMFSRYDIDIYLDDQQLMRLKHGSTKALRLTLEPGHHTFRFTKAGYYSPNGSVMVNVTSNLQATIGLYCTMDAVSVDYSATEIKREEPSESTVTQPPETKPGQTDAPDSTNTETPPETAPATENPVIDEPFSAASSMRALIVAMTNGQANDVFGSDGFTYDVSKFRRYSDTAGFFLNVEAEGFWSEGDNSSWNVRNAVLRINGADSCIRVSCNVRFDGKNYIVSNVTRITADIDNIYSDDPALTRTEHLEPSKKNPFLTVSPDLIRDNR